MTITMIYSVCMTVAENKLPMECINYLSHVHKMYLLHKKNSRLKLNFYLMCFIGHDEDNDTHEYYMTYFAKS
jgi:hypothetical protein